MKTILGYSPRSLLRLLPLLLVGLACSFTAPQVNNDTLLQTDIALGIQQTLVAQTAEAMTKEQALPPVTPVAVTASPVVIVVTNEATEIPATEAPPPTEAPPAASDTPTVTEAVSSNEPIILTHDNTKLGGFVKGRPGCVDDVKVCWILTMSGSGMWKTNAPTNALLESTQTYLIDPAWPNPYIVFQHDLSLRTFSASIRIERKTGWMDIYPIDRNHVGIVTVSLKPFKGESLRLGFYATTYHTGRTSPMNITWKIGDIQIVPDYQP